MVFFHFSRYSYSFIYAMDKTIHAQEIRMNIKIYASKWEYASSKQMGSRQVPVGVKPRYLRFCTIEFIKP